MKLYSVEDLKQRYDDKPSSATIYKYFKRKELEEYIIQDHGKKLTEEGVHILDEIRNNNKKYRGEVKEEPEDTQDNTSNFKTSNNNNSNYEVVIQALTEQLKVKDEQLKQKDLQITRLYDILEKNTNTIALQNGTLQLKEHKDILKEQTEEKQNIIFEKEAEAVEKKSFFNWFFKK